jgi:hypothetical protein
MEVFEMWLRGCDGELDVDIDYALQRADPALAWFREIYDRLGPISARQLRTQLEGAQREALTAALAIIAEDVRSDGRRMIVEQIQERPNARIPESHEFYLLGRVVESWIAPDAVWEIGDIVQEEIMERAFETWPVCDQHGFGLHLEMVDGRVVWWCRPRSHVVRVVYQPLSVAAGTGRWE